MPEPRRTFQVTLALGVLVVYGLVALEIGRSHYSLVSDYIDIALIHGGWWPAGILRRLIDPFAPGAWLYRPFADAASWVLALLLERHVGAWHALLIAVRLVSAWAAFALARGVAGSAVATCTAASYFAFFTAIPEVDLIRVETFLILALSVAFYGYWRMTHGGASSAVVAMTSVAFVCATMSKEVVAPLLFVLLCFAAPVLWRRGRGSRWALALMIAAMANQIVRFALLAREPYAHSEHGRLLQQAVWVAKVLLLATTNVPIVPLFLVACIALGLYRLWRIRNAPAVCAMALLLLSVAMAVAAPYPAIRYLSPSALFIVPFLAAGIDEIRQRVKPAIVDAAAYAAMLLFIIFGGAQMLAQAVAMRNSTAADWALLEYAARAMAGGRDVFMVEDPDFERAFWVRAELAGVDARYPFITYVASRSAAGLPIVWPAPPAPPVNLTGLLPPNPRGRFATARLPFRFAPEGLVIPPNPWVRSVAANVVPERLFDFRDDAFTRGLTFFYRVARRLNPKFHYLFDLGESEFPGHSWVTFAAR